MAAISVGWPGTCCQPRAWTRAIVPQAMTAVRYLAMLDPGNWELGTVGWAGRSVPRLGGRAIPPRPAACWAAWSCRVSPASDVPAELTSATVRAPLRRRTMWRKSTCIFAVSTYTLADERCEGGAEAEARHGGRSTVT